MEAVKVEYWKLLFEFHCSGESYVDWLIGSSILNVVPSVLEVLKSTFPPSISSPKNLTEYVPKPLPFSAFVVKYF